MFSHSWGNKVAGNEQISRAISAAWNGGPFGLRIRVRAEPRSLCLEPPFTLCSFCLSVVSQLCGSNLARPPEALVLWLALLWG